MKSRLLLLFLFLNRPTAAQFSPAFFDQLSVEDGLSQSEVYSVLKDRQGYVWLGTQDGLNRYDGYRFEHFKHDPFDANSLSNDYITALFEDAQGTLWVGTQDGLNRYDATAGRFVRFTDTTSERVHQPFNIQAFATDRHGTLWVGTKLGLRRVIRDSAGGYRVRVYRPGPESEYRRNSVLSLLTDRRGTVWVGTAGDLHRVHIANPAAPPDRQSVVLRPAVDPTQPRFWLPGSIIRALAEDRFGMLWVGTERGLARLDPVTLQVLPQPAVSERMADKWIRTLLVDKSGLLWVGSGQEGIYRFQLPNGQTARFQDAFGEDLLAKKGLKSSFINVLYEGTDPQEDLVWIGTHNAGAQVYSRSKNSFRQWDLLTDQHQSSSVNLVFALCTDRLGDLWIGTHGGLLRVNRQTGASRRYALESARLGGSYSQEINSLLEDHQGTLWVGSNGGLFRYERERDQFQFVPMDQVLKGDEKKMLTGTFVERVFSLYEDSRQNLWIGTGRSLKRRDPRTGQLMAYEYDPADSTSLRPFMVESIQEDGRGNLWVGTANGLNKLDLRTSKASFFRTNPKDPASLPGNSVLDIHRDRRGQLWFCTNKGLSRLFYEKGRERFENFTEKNCRRGQGLPNGMVYGTLEDEHGRLWLSTNLGLSCFDPLKKTFKNYDINDGLTHNEFNMGAFTRSREGELFFGGIGMVVSFRPSALVENRHRPRVVLSSFSTFDRPLNADSLLARRGQLDFRHTENFFTLGFAALDFTNPHKNQYAYRLEGLDDQWISNGTRRYVSFANLPPGEYVLHVRASNGNGWWSGAPLRIPLRIRPPFWRTGWFYALSFVVLAGSAWAFYRYRLRKGVAHLLELERVVLEENERVRKLAAQDLHDEFGNTITRISMLTELIKARLNGHGEEISPLLTKISDNSNRLYQGTKDFIWAINPEHDNFFEVAIRLKDFGDDVFDRSGVTFQAYGIGDELRRAELPMGASRHLVLLFKEAMSNTLKHARATEASLHFVARPTGLEVTWRDNGLGFEASSTTPGNGLQNIRSRAGKIGGEIQILSPPGGGTAITFRLKQTASLPHIG
ncbi:MAG: hypothetical protein H7Y12_12050 [Sphingobacteriaceae bacterium]|nr:hypothetical protein [Cytophagaceae bacterium]